jgi:hypothetical protein
MAFVTLESGGQSGATVRRYIPMLSSLVTQRESSMNHLLILLNSSVLLSLMIGLGERGNYERCYGRQGDADEDLFHDNLHFVLGAAD